MVRVKQNEVLICPSRSHGLSHWSLAPFHHISPPQLGAVFTIAAIPSLQTASAKVEHDLHEYENVTNLNNRFDFVVNTASE